MLIPSFSLHSEEYWPRAENKDHKREYFWGKSYWFKCLYLDTQANVCMTKWGIGNATNKCDKLTWKLSLEPLKHEMQNTLQYWEQSLIFKWRKMRNIAMCTCKFSIGNIAMCTHRFSVWNSKEVQQNLFCTCTPRNLCVRHRIQCTTWHPRVQRHLSHTNTTPRSRSDRSSISNAF